LPVEFKAKLLHDANQVPARDLRKKRAHAATRIGFMMTSSEGTGSEWSFRLSIYN
jgi:hypothetical protein